SDPVVSLQTSIALQGRKARRDLQVSRQASLRGSAGTGAVEKEQARARAATLPVPLSFLPSPAPALPRPGGHTTPRARPRSGGHARPSIGKVERAPFLVGKPWADGRTGRPPLTGCRLWQGALPPSPRSLGNDFPALGRAQRAPGVDADGVLDAAHAAVAQGH